MFFIFLLCKILGKITIFNPNNEILLAFFSLLSFLCALNVILFDKYPNFVLQIITICI